jgi:hypothetical protein
MRVATVFTGVVTCTAAGVTQAAHAGTITGNIKSVSSCGYYGIDPTWLHVSTVSTYTDLGVTTTAWMSDCFGNHGQYKWPRGIGIVAECGGNNYGQLSGATASEKWWWTSFGPGTTYRVLQKAHLSDVLISRWAGTDKCPVIPNFGQYITNP